MHSASRQALATLREQLSAVTNRFSTVDGLTGLSAELTQVVDLLINQPPLRRRLADPSTKPERRAGLAGQLLDGKLGTSSVQVVRDAVSLRWSSAVGPDRRAGDHRRRGAAGGGRTERDVETVEDELFRFGRIIDGDSRLSTLLDDYAADDRPSRRAAASPSSSARSTPSPKCCWSTRSPASASARSRTRSTPCSTWRPSPQPVHGPCHLRGRADRSAGVPAGRRAH